VIEIIEGEGDHTQWFLLTCSDRGKQEPDCPSICLDSELAKAIVDTRDAARRLYSSVRSNQAKVSSGHDDTNRKTFFDYRAAARLKEAQRALDQLICHKGLTRTWLYTKRNQIDPAGQSS
jgi:hypothetical protein